MRTSKEMLDLFENIAKSDERIRVMTLEGSRVNPSVTPDIWQDYDITFLVTDVKSFTASDEWLSVFGDMVFMQKPEAMELFPSHFPDDWFSYLMLFSDGVKIDLSIISLDNLKKYFENDPLIKILLDKDNICPEISKPSDKSFWVEKPTVGCVNDCANEFLFVSTYVAKGLLRDELLFANWHFEHILRVELHRMLGYLAGARNGFPLNTGKRDKWLPKFLTKDECEKLLDGYNLKNIAEAWNALYMIMQLFEDAMKEVCNTLEYECLYSVEVVRKYIQTIKDLK